MELLDKKYYRIKDVAEILDVPQSTLRFWEKEFPEAAPRRNSHNIRYYKPEDIETLRIIKFLVKDKGLKINAAKEQLKTNRRNVVGRIDIINRLESVKQSLEMLLSSLNKRELSTDNNETDEKDSF